MPHLNQLHEVFKVHLLINGQLAVMVDDAVVLHLAIAADAQGVITGIVGALSLLFSTCKYGRFRHWGQWWWAWRWWCFCLPLCSLLCWCGYWPTWELCSTGSLFLFWVRNTHLCADVRPSSLEAFTVKKEFVPSSRNRTEPWTSIWQKCSISSKWHEEWVRKSRWASELPELSLASVCVEGPQWHGSDGLCWIAILAGSCSFFAKICIFLQLSFAFLHSLILFVSVENGLINHLDRVISPVAERSLESRQTGGEFSCWHVLLCLSRWLATVCETSAASTPHAQLCQNESSAVIVCCYWGLI